MEIPSREECLTLLKANNTPSNVIKHCIAVCDFALDLAEKIQKSNHKVNIGLVAAACLLHDIERSKENHVEEGAELLKRLGYAQVAKTAKKHGLNNIYIDGLAPKTTEEKIVFYADKRVVEDKVVGLRERFTYLEKKYRHDFSQGFRYARQIEKELYDMIKCDLAGERINGKGLL